MTKIKNTKKGMAKKTLSMSLVVAMLATSNVPVWAAEFSDGSDAAVTAETENFTSTNDVAPAVEEDTENTVSAQAEAGARFDFSDLKFTKDPSYGTTKQKLFTSGAVKDASGNPVASNTICFRWQTDGLDRTGNDKDATDILNATMTFSLKDIGTRLSVRFFEKGKPETTIGTIDLGTVQPQQVSDVVTGMNFSSSSYAYTGQASDAQKVPESLNQSGSTFTPDDFDWSWSGCEGSKVGTVNVTGTLKAAKAAETGCTGTISGFYNIVAQTNFASEWLKKEVTLNTTDAGEYTGANLSMDASAVTVKIAGTDIKLPVKSVETNGANAGDETLKITFDSAKLNATGNFNLSSDPYIITDTKQVAKIAVRDLSKGTAKVNVTYAVGDIQNENSVLAKRVSLTGADGKTISADTLGSNITVKVLGNVKDYQKAGTYANAVEIKAITGNKNVTGTVYADLVVSDQSFKDAAKFLGTVGNNLSTTVAGAKELKDYTGEAVEFTSAELGKFSPNGDSTTTADQHSFTITYNNNVNASTADKVASITITGNAGTDYAGCTKTFYFKIKPAKVTASNTETANTVTVAKDVSINANATSAADYKDAIALTIKAKSGTGTTVKSFDLVDGTDYTCTYTYTDKNGIEIDADTDKNVVGQYVKVVAAITNTNYSVATGNSSTITGDNAKNTVTAIVPIVKKTITDATITLDKDNYVYTGKDIIPTVTVTADGKTLKEGTDYKVSVINGREAGTGTVVVTTLDGTYKAGTVLKKEFTIAKANAENVTVTVAKKTSVTGDIKYTGTAWDGSKLDYTVKLDGVDVKGQFKATWGENINAGKKGGTLTLTPNTAGSKNFEGTKEFTFEIKGETLSGSLDVYDENGTKISSTSNGITGTYEYTGSPITFEKYKFNVKTPAGKKLTEGKDYEIVYVDNTSSGDAYMCVVGKGNYVGSYELESEETEKTVSNIVTSLKFSIKGSRFTAKDVTVKNGVYAGGLVVKPQVTIKKGTKTLVEGVDYKVILDDPSKSIDATTKNTLKFSIKGLGEYNEVAKFNLDASGKYYVYGIDKFNLKDASVTSDGKTVTVRNGNIVVPSTEYTYEIKDGKVTVTATEGNKNYTGTITTDVNNTYVGAPMIDRINVSGNNATVILSDEAEGASGYDYAISTSNDPTDKEARIDVVKNQVQTLANFKYVPQGMYYAYCHAWTRDENGKKVFGEWSNVKSFTVTATTPKTPEILSVKRSGSTITVTYKESAYSEGYDVVLGNGSKKEHGETRPYQYGKYKKLNVKPGVCKAVFKNIPAGTYYVGVHSWNRSAEENNNKVFSKWSDLEKVTVK